MGEIKAAVFSLKINPTRQPCFVKMQSNLSSATPLLVLHASSLSSIQFPRDWCDMSRDLASCMCEDQRDVLITDISGAGDAINSFNDTQEDTEGDLARMVDWWTEGVVLPIICAVGILGKFLVTGYFLPDPSLKHPILT